MTRHNPIHPGLPADDNPNLDAELLALAAELDHLGALDRAALDGLEDRAFQASLGALHGVQPVAAQAAELGALDRAAAPRDLEEGVFQESVPALRAGASPGPVVVRHIAPAERTRGREHARQAIRPWWSRGSVRLAASLTLFIGVGLALYSSMQYNDYARTRLAEKVGTDMDTLFAVMHASDTQDTSTESDPDRVAEWLSEGASS